MKDKTPIPDHALFAEGTYAWFHFQMIGKEFTDGLGNTSTKLDVYNEYKKFPGTLRLIMAGKFRDLQPVDKSGWKDGILIDKRSYAKSSYGTMILV